MPSPPMRYLKKIGWLLGPVFVWNAALSPRLPPAFSPAVFWRAIPTLLAATENGLRVAHFALLFFAPFELVARPQKVGLAHDGAGIAVCFAS
ncbi:MAG: hypothetical protein IPJ17_17545 [Holophagales bacterium]|nr:MAG: hypothetical protein IPJ17_17545 [Holophagales bacterium]